MHHIVYTRVNDGVDVWWKQKVGNFQENPAEFGKVEYKKKTQRIDNVKMLIRAYGQPRGVDKEK